MINLQDDREGRIEFADLTLKVFGFLLQLRFRVASRKATFVRFESNEVFLNIYHGRSSYQVGLEIGRMGSSELYSLHEVLSYVAPNEIEKARCQAVTYDVLERCLSKIASTVDQQCRNLLLGDADAFETLKSTASALRKKATIQAQFGGIIDKADKAWEAKEFDRAAELYKAAERALDKTRSRRLVYLKGRKTSDD